MVKVVVMFRFRTDVERDECIRRYLEEHPAVVREVLPDARRYVQGLPLRYRSEDFSWDGFSELWFDDEDAFRQAFKSPRIAELRADEERFIGELSWGVVTEIERF